MLSDRAHPGKILWEEFMEPDGITVSELADALNVPDTHIQAIIDQRCEISDIMAIRMAKHFNTSQLFWSQLQSACKQVD
jgi:addiction module HigA family antidote